MKTFYLFDPKIKWSVFKKVHDKIVKESGPTPEHGTKILCEMVRDKQILAGFSPKLKNDMWLGLKPPKGYKIEFICNPKK